MRRCAFCFKEADGDEHHAIPEFIYKMFEVQSEPDFFRIVLCEKCHRNFNKEWDKIRFVMRKRLK